MRVAVLALLAVTAAAHTVRELRVAPDEVPALASAYEELVWSHGRQLLQAAGDYGYGYGYGYGGYYDSVSGRFLMEAGYGGYGGYYGGYYYGDVERSMLETRFAPAPEGAPDMPEGKCYCRYDTAYSSWALAENACKDALYQKCQADARLPCGWLESYYGSSMMTGRQATALPHEQEIAAFLFADCVAAPPCNCRGMRFDGSDDAATSYACCQDLRAQCRRPGAGVTCQQVAAYCQADETSSALADWVAVKLAAPAACDTYPGSPFTYQRLPDMLAAGQAPAAKLTASDRATAPQMLAGDEDAGAASQALMEQAQKLSAQPQQAQLSLAASLLLVVGGGLVAAAVAGAAMAVGAFMGRRRDDDLAAPLIREAPRLPRVTSNLLPPTPMPSKHPSRTSSQSSLHE